MKKLLVVLLASTLAVSPALAQSVRTSGAYSNAAIGQLPGTATNDNAAAGNIGQYIESVVAPGSAVALTSGTQTNVTSISLPPGDWDVSGQAYFTTTATTSYTRYVSSVSLTSAGVDGTPGRFSDNTIPATTPNGLSLTSVITPYRFSLSATTTIFLVVVGGFSASTSSAYGIIRARRVR